MTTGGAVVPVVMESKIPKETHRFTWSIADFAEVKNSRELVEALAITFEMGQSIGLPVTFKAFLQLHVKENEPWIGWYSKVLQAPNDVKGVMGLAACKIGSYCDLKGKGARKYVVGGTNTGVWGWKDVIPQNVDVSKLPLDVNGALPIEISMTLYNTEGTSVTVADVMAKFQGTFTRNLTENMEVLYKEPMAFVASGTPAVISVVSKDGRTVSSIAAHLAARSPVFRTMFQSPMTEAAKGVVKMEDIGGEALEVLLHFLHTATLKNNWKEPDVLEELTHAAHKYLMQDLLEFLDEAIGLACAPENCLSMIRLANRLELKKAKEALLKMHQDQWKQATDVGKMMELLQE